MTGSDGWALGELIGAGFLALAVVLIALLSFAAALHTGRTQSPDPEPARRVDPFEVMLFARYTRGEIDAAEYHAAVDRLAGDLR